ncbi:MAG: hypothetical protein IJB85_02980 [Clostridia bacterium]|nr:hypothetical protein [Clostridia bacterium]
MKKRMLLVCLLLACLFAGTAMAGETKVTLPAGYADSGLRYPVIYLMPEDGYASDESGLAGKLSNAMDNGLGMRMIVAQVVFAEEDDPAAALRAAVGEVESAYRVAEGPQHRVLLGSGAGGYLAYTLGLEMKGEFGAMVSIRGNFADHAWIAKLGDLQTRIEQVNADDAEYFNTVYTYMDAPVEDAYSNQPGGTNELGALFIGYGTGSAAHEYTVRPGAYDGAFIDESVARVMNRLTARMLGGCVSGGVSLEKAALTAADETANVRYSVVLAEEFDALVSDGKPAVEIVIDVIDPVTGELLDQQIIARQVTGLGEIAGECAVKNAVNGTTSAVKLGVRTMGAQLELATATLMRMQDPMIDGDVQKIDLTGDWHFNYTGMDMVDVAALAKAEYESWPVVQPGITSWEKGFGNISDENVASGYGPDYFNFFIVGSGYYAKTFTVPAEFDAKDLLLSIGYVDDRCEVFLNGTRVGATGMDENGRPTGDTTWAVYSCFEIDEALLNRGGENTVIVRAWNDLPFGAGGWYGGPTALYSKAAFELENGGGASERFYEENFKSEYAAKGLGKSEAIQNNYLIYLPEGYSESNRRYPTVYLLHQFNSDHTSYRGDRVNELFDAGVREGLFDEMIVVIPNSSEESWWTGDWEKMITEELIPHIDGKYRTIRDARYRLTAGCSMGGQGAMAVALRNPDCFTGAVSFFGAFSYGGASSPNTIAARESAEYMDSFSLYFICGNQDSYGFGVPAISLHQQLENMGVNHRFFIDNGGHDSAFYIPFFKDAFAYIRSDMYKSDEAIETLIKGGLTVVGTQVTARMDTLPGIEAYLHTIPASSYTRDPNPALNAALTITVIQNGKEVVYDSPSHRCADNFSTVIELDVATNINASQPFEVILTASILDRTIELARISK